MAKNDYLDQMRRWNRINSDLDEFDFMYRNRSGILDWIEFSIVSAIDFLFNVISFMCEVFYRIIIYLFLTFAGISVLIVSAIIALMFIFR